MLDLIELSERKRFELKGDRIRALYGHSNRNSIEKKRSIPPRFLYHGTQKSNIDSILEKGLLPMDRQYVHLFVDKLKAQEVASRRKGEICVLMIEALSVHENGVNFYSEPGGIWLAEKIPRNFISNEYTRT